MQGFHSNIYNLWIFGSIFWLKGFTKYFKTWNEQCSKLSRVKVFEMIAAWINKGEISFALLK